MDVIGKGDFYFKKGNGESVLLLSGCTIGEALKEMTIFLKEKNYKSYYTRSWHEGNEIWFDVGSWSEFFIFKEVR